MSHVLSNGSNRISATALCSVSALCFWLGWPPHRCTPLLFMAFVPLLCLAHRWRGASVKPHHRIHFYGYTYLTLCLWNASTNWWICKATLGGGLFAIFFNAAWMSWPLWLFYNRQPQLGYVGSRMLLVAAWLCMEHWHLGGHISFPWLNLGNGLACRTRWAQWYAYTGTLGGSTWILGANLWLLHLCTHWRSGTWKRSLLPAMAWLVGPVCVSYVLYCTYTPCGQRAEVVVAQLGLDPYTRAYAASPHCVLSDDQLVRHLCSLSTQAVTQETSFLVWPESALDQPVDEAMLSYSSALSYAKRFARTYPALSLLVGARTYKMYGSQRPTPSAQFHAQGFYYDAFNTALFIKDQTQSLAIYHKSKLVPGAEEVPFAFALRWLEGWPWLFKKLNGYNFLQSLGAQKEPTVFFNHQGVGIAPIVCYESIYGAHVARFVRAGAALIAISTIDGWWGNTPGYRQHFHYARLRAIENRRCVARSAFEGISGFIDQRGEVLDAARYGQKTVLKQSLLASTDLTFYTRYGDYIASGAMWLAIIVWMHNALVRWRMRRVAYGSLR